MIVSTAVATSHLNELTTYRINFALWLMGQNFTKFEDFLENRIMNLPQLQCLVGNSRSNFIKFIKIKLS